MDEKETKDDMIFWEKVATRQAKALKDLETGREGMVLIKIMQTNMDFQDRKIEQLEKKVKALEQAEKEAKKK